ncbi:MAG: hypothetical protein WD512_18695 [Candidatus Paceibacterota bacterium]
MCRLKLSSKEIKYNSEDTSQYILSSVPTEQIDINQERNNLFRSLRNSYNNNYSDLIEHPYGPSRRFNVIPHSYIPNGQEENNDIQLAIYLSLYNDDDNIIDDLD